MTPPPSGKPPARTPPPRTPDGRYIVVRGRLWRATRPDLPPERAAALRSELSSARSTKGHAKRRGDADTVEAARRRVDAAKHALGERGPVWWTDGAPDYNRCLAKNTPYARWWAGVAGGAGGAGGRNP